MSLLAELKRRNVIRVAGLYLVGAWLLVQVSSTILPMFSAPDWLPRTIVLALAIGFVPALIFSWVFELTPDGLKRDAEVKPEESIAPQTARRMDRILLVVSILAIGYFAFDKFVLAPRREAALVAQTTQQLTDKANEEKSAINPHSIAVLPFVNMSGDAQNAYFSDGISEEILNVLARIPELQVAARTSSFSFKGGNKEVPEIARELKVRMVLEGSVRKQDARVRITAQLIDASNGFHVWSQTYDRDLKDIFAIQDEIANAIAGELQVKLGRAVPAGESSTGTRNLEAYDLYLRGLGLWQQRREDTLWQAVDLFERAARADSGFAQAYAGQALVYAVLADYSTRISYDDGRRKARNFAERALALDPSLPEPYAALGAVARDESRRDDAEALLRRAIAIKPSFATAYQWIGTNQMRAGHLDTALASLERATMLDPRSLVVANNHSWILLTLGRYAEAKAVCQHVLAFAPTYNGCIDNVAFGMLLQGESLAAKPLLDRLAAATNPGASVQVSALIDVLQGTGDRRAFATQLAAFPHRSSLDPASGNLFIDYEIPPLLMLLHEDELALRYLQGAAEMGDSNNIEWAIGLQALDPIRCDPRFVALVKKLVTLDPRFEKTCKGRP